MNIGEVKAAVYQLLTMYFAGAVVVWANTKKVEPQYPFVTVRMESVTRTQHPNMKVIDGQPCGFYPSKAVFEVQLFTNGKEISTGEGSYVANTAVDDMNAFLNFLLSPMAQDWCSERNMTIIPQSPIQDITALTDDIDWAYRAMLEFAVYFTLLSVGYSGILAEESVKKNPAAPDDLESSTITPEWEITASGGGSTEELAKKEIGYFTEAEVKGEF